MIGILENEFKLKIMNIFASRDPYLVEEWDEALLQVYYIAAMWILFAVMSVGIPIFLLVSIYHAWQDFIKWIRNGNHKKEEQESSLLHSA
jgi:hypothetical protein